MGDGDEGAFEWYVYCILGNEPLTLVPESSLVQQGQKNQITKSHMVNGENLGRADSAEDIDHLPSSTAPPGIHQMRATPDRCQIHEKHRRNRDVSSPEPARTGKASKIQQGPMDRPKIRNIYD
jgi:hypothetical protein